MPIEFTATESGFDKGLGGASNKAVAKPYHYVLFGEQVDEQHSFNSGIYFEFDDQINGSINQVRSVSITNKMVEFALKSGDSIKVTQGRADQPWHAFLEGIRAVFKNLCTG